MKTTKTFKKYVLTQEKRYKITRSYQKRFGISIEFQCNLHEIL